MIPDIRKEIIVATDPSRAFTAFWSEIGNWWPLHSHSLSGMQGKVARGVRLEPRLGGAIIETMSDGSAATWGKVTEWDPGKVLEFTWQLHRPEDQATRVRVTFAETEAGTRITLLHSGWEAVVGDGPAIRANYDSGWEAVFMSAYRSAAARAA